MGLAMGGTPVLWCSFAHHDGNLVKDLMHFMARRKTDNIEKSFSAMILTLQKITTYYHSPILNSSELSVRCCFRE